MCKVFFTHFLTYVKMRVFQSQKKHLIKILRVWSALFCLCNYLPCDVFLEAFLAESCSPSLSSLLLNFRSSSNILTLSTVNSNLDLSWNMKICFSVLITNLKIPTEVVKRMKHLRWLVITGFGLMAAWALGRTSSLYKKQDALVQSIFKYSFLNIHIHLFKSVQYSLCPLGNGWESWSKKNYFIIQFVYTVSIKWMNELKKSDLGWEGEFGRFCFAGGVNGCERRGPWLSHFLRKKEKCYSISLHDWISEWATEPSGRCEQPCTVYTYL